MTFTKKSRRVNKTNERTNIWKSAQNGNTFGSSEILSRQRIISLLRRAHYGHYGASYSYPERGEES